VVFTTCTPHLPARDGSPVGVSGLYLLWWVLSERYRSTLTRSASEGRTHFPSLALRVRVDKPPYRPEAGQIVAVDREGVPQILGFSAIKSLSDGDNKKDGPAVGQIGRQSQAFDPSRENWKPASPNFGEEHVQKTGDLAPPVSRPSGYPRPWQTSHAG